MKQATFMPNVTKVTPKDGGVFLHETITMKAPDLLFANAFNQTVAVHEEMLKLINTFVESTDKS